MLFSIFLKSFQDILRPRVLTWIALPFIGSFLIWGLITWLIWDWILNLGFNLYNLGIMQRLVQLLSPYFLITADPLASVTAAAFILVVILPAAMITALFITSIVLVPILVRELKKTDFPQVILVSNSMLTGTGTSISYSIKYIFCWVASLPLWIAIPFGAVFIPFLLLAWFNSRLFTWEVMTEIATQEEIKLFVEDHSRALFLLGLMTAGLYYVPILNFFAPVISSAAFARFCLTKSKNPLAK